MPRPTKYPHLMVTEGKHSDAYYLLNNEEDLHKVAFALVKERAADGYWYPTLESIEADRQRHLDSIEAGKDSDYTDLTDEQVDALPEPLKEKAVAARTKYAKAVANAEAQYRQDKGLVNAINEVINDPNGHTLTRKDRKGREFNLALAILNSRSDYQYEGYRFESFENVE